MRLLHALSSLAFVLALTFPAAAETNGIPWHTNMESAWKTMKESQRPMLLFFTTDGCLYCEKMYEGTFKNRDVISDISKNYVAASVHADTVPNVIERLGVSVYPTTAIISPQARVLDVIPGYASAEKLRQRMDAANRKLAQEATTAVAKPAAHTDTVKKR